MVEHTPTRLPVLNDAPRLLCRKCGYSADKPHPVLRLACPICFSRWLAHHVPQLEEVMVAAPIAPPADAALDLKPRVDQRGIPTQVIPRVPG